MVTTEVQELQAVYYGLSTDEKPIEYVSNGSAFVEFQPDESVVVYFFDGENKRWMSDGGGGGNGDNRGIPEAPTDGKNYVRYNSMWKEISDAPLDGNNYVRTAYPHIIGTNLYLYHYLLKDRLDFYVYVEYTKVTP